MFQLTVNANKGKGVVIVKTPQEMWDAIDSLLNDGTRYVVVVSKVVELMVNTPGWTAEDRERALEQPEDLDE